MKKTITFAMMLMMMLASKAEVFGADFRDLKRDDWAFQAVEAMSEKGVVKGYPDGSFRPSNTVTYGEFIKMALIAGTGENADNAASGHWAMNYYNKAVELKYFTGYDIDKSQLDDRITRSDMALIISSVLGEIKIRNYDEIQKGIKDISYRTEHEYDIIKSYASGVLTGYTDHTFKPDRTLTRAEAAAVIHRLVDESKRKLPNINTSKTEKGTAVSTIAEGFAGIFQTSGLLDMGRLTPDKIVTKSARFTDEYELYQDASVWGLKMFRAFNGDSCAFDHTMKGFIYLVRDGQLVEYCSTGPMYDDEGISYLGFQRSRAVYDISTVDYIICVPSNAKAEENELIKVIVNPFRE